MRSWWRCGWWSVAAHGQVIDLPLLEPMISVLGPDAAIYKVSGQKPRRTGSRSADHLAAPTYMRRATIASSRSRHRSRQWRNALFRAIGKPEMIDRPAVSHQYQIACVTSMPATRQLVSSLLLARWPNNMAIFEAAEVTANPVYEIDQLIEDAHVHGRGVLVEAPDAEAGSGVLMHNIIPRLSETPGRFRSAAPNLGQHSRSVLESIGLATDGGSMRWLPMA